MSAQDYNFETSSVQSCSTNDSRQNRPLEELEQMVDQAIANQEWLNMMAQSLLSVMEKPKIAIPAENS